MPRPLRIEYEGAWYHVMNRGANHANIFFESAHKAIFLGLLQESILEFSIEIHSYCLMDNHYHLLVHTPLGNLAKAMRYINGVYTQRLNRMLNRDGPLFRGRYKAILVEEESYLLHVSRYIHLNPLKANICNPESFEWSSYREYIGKSRKNTWLTISTLLNMVSGKNPQESYRLFHDDSITDSRIEKFYNKDPIPSILGTKDFVENNIRKLDENKIFHSSIDINHCKLIIPIENVLIEIVNYFKIDNTSLKNSIRGKQNIPRIVSIYLARQLCKMSYQQISEYFSTNNANVGSSMKRFKKLINTDLNLKKRVVCLIELIINHFIAV